MTTLFVLLTLLTAAAGPIAYPIGPEPVIQPAQAYMITTVPPPDPSVCPPNFVIDSIAIPIGCPNLLYRVTVEPSTGLIAVNDNPLSQGLNSNGGTGDGDFDDGSVQFYIIPVSLGFDTVYVSWYAALSNQANSIEINGFTFNAANEMLSPGYFPVGTFAVGTELDFVEITQDGHIYDSLRTDQGANWFVEYQHFTGETGLTGVPEAGSFLLIGGVFVMLALFSKVRLWAGVLRSRYPQC